MASSASPMLQSHRSHVHVDSVCPWCEQSITHDKFEEISAKIAAEEKERLAALENTLRDQFAGDRALAEEKRKTEIAAAQETAAAAIAKAKEAAKAASDAQAAEAARKLAETVQQVKSEAETAAAEKIAASRALADKAAAEKLAAESQLKEDRETFTAKAAEAEEKHKADLIAAAAAKEAAVTEKLTGALEEAARKVAVAEAAKAALEKETGDKLAAAEAARVEAEKKFATQKTAHDAELEARLNEVRESLGKEKTKALLDEQAKTFADRQKLTEQVQNLQRQIDNKTASELGEGAELDLVEELKAAFEGDNFRRVPKGVNGADIIHEVIENGKVCGKIVYDSKNHKAWQNNFAVKLHADMIAEKADHAVLSTNTFPAGKKQLELRENVIIACPARVVALAELLRRHIVQTYALRLSGEQRDDKTAELYSFIVSERCTQLLDSVESIIKKMEELDVEETKAHRTVWEKRGKMLKDVLKSHGSFTYELDHIIGTAEAAE